jgi:hypothetical protein
MQLTELELYKLKLAKLELSVAENAYSEKSQAFQVVFNEIAKTYNVAPDKLMINPDGQFTVIPDPEVKKED